VQEWINEENGIFAEHIATRAAQWGADQQLKLDAEQIAQAYQAGADQELEACVQWVSIQLNCTDQEHLVPHLRAARRPKPPSLKEQALAALDDAIMRGDCITISDALPTLRRALEALPND
jgi:ABC-type thiamine transport system ATPase subunit